MHVIQIRRRGAENDPTKKKLCAADFYIDSKRRPDVNNDTEDPFIYAFFFFFPILVLLLLLLVLVTATLLLLLFCWLVDAAVQQRSHCDAMAKSFK